MREAIDSALAQTYPNTEIIVINDGSTDNGITEEIALSYGDKIRYISKENGGVSSALNVGIKNMKGEYFSWLSHDDAYTPDKIEKQVRALSTIDDKNALVCCGSVHIDKNSKLIGTMPDSERVEVEFLHWEEALMQLLKNGSMNGCALLIKKSVFDDVGLFDESLRFNQDGFMWNKIFLKKYSMLIISDICVKGRIHDKQLTQTGQALFHNDCEKMSEFLIPKLLEISSTETNFILEYIKYNAKYGNTSVVNNAYTKAKKAQLLPLLRRIEILLWKVYGFVRPTIRKIYYLLVRRMKTS